MAGQRDCDSVVTVGRMSKATEFFDAADHLGEEMPNAAGDLYVDAGIAVAPLKRADNGSERHLSTLLNLKNKAAYTHQDLTSAELKKMNRAAEHLAEAAKQAMATRR
jgi:hypothetical protein